MNSVGDRLKCIRGTTSQNAFAAQFGIHRNTLVRWESGERLPDFDFLVSLVNNFGIAPEWMLTGKGDMHASECSPSAPPDSEKTSDTSEVLKLKKNQTTENIDIRKNKTSDTSEILESQQEINALNRELRDLLRENGDLRVDIERKKARIAELERELVRVLKGEEDEDLASAG